ncbi:MAG TPA: Zn-dependent hydrolase [Homoserinimonas sp.]|nr:Zn-dependent hydrolase [Homoserinimonas sp.]
MIAVNAERLMRDLDELGAIGRVTEGGITRASFGHADLEARQWYLARCAEAGLDARVDGIGNIIVSLRSTPEVASRAAVWSGSHIDTVPNGGAFDGALGALAALETLRTVQERGIELARPVNAMVYADEEGNFASLLGSGALVRGYAREELERMVGRDGDRFVDAFVAAGGDIDAATRTIVAADSVHATVELHIEQGPVLEDLRRQIGVVTGIVGLGDGTVTFRGRADHAGTTPMGRRQDALVSASAFVVSMPDLASQIGADSVITCGLVRVDNGSSNVVPGIVHVTVEFRDRDPGRMRALERLIGETALAIAGHHRVAAEWTCEPVIPPVPMDAGIQAMIAGHANARGLTTLSLMSGAGHDSQNLAALAPTGMIFVPSAGGRSHRPDEYTSSVDIENGANVLLDTLIQLATG